MVAYAKSLGCNDIEFSPEDAGRWVLGREQHKTVQCSIL